MSHPTKTFFPLFHGSTPVNFFFLQNISGSKELAGSHAHNLLEIMQLPDDNLNDSIMPPLCDVSFTFVFLGMDPLWLRVITKGVIEPIFLDPGVDPSGLAHLKAKKINILP